MKLVRIKGGMSAYQTIAGVADSALNPGTYEYMKAAILSKDQKNTSIGVEVPVGGGECMQFVMATHEDEDSLMLALIVNYEGGDIDYLLQIILTLNENGEIEYGNPICAEHLLADPDDQTTAQALAGYCRMVIDLQKVLAVANDLVLNHGSKYTDDVLDITMGPAPTTAVPGNNTVH